MDNQTSIDYSLLLDDSLTRASGGAEKTQGNGIKYLKDAKENFPAWLEGINSAKHFICIEMYIWEPKNFGEEVRDLLIKKLNQQVKVYICYDWFGSLGAYFKRFFTPLIEAGGQVVAYNKLTVLSGLGFLSRNHRKSIVIDGQLAFVSGLCFSSDWEGNPKKGIPPWRDSGLELTGPVVLDVLDAFIDTWDSISKIPFKEQLINAEIIPEKGQLIGTCRVVNTSRLKGNLIRFDLFAISFAEESIWITDAYFMPTSMYLQLLINAAKDGVDVRILVPRSSDIPWIASVSRTQYRSMLEAGVRIYEWNGSMIHSKTLLIDGKWGRVGSTNLNMSSWFANSELDIVIETKEAVRPMVEAFLDDLQKSTEMVLGEDKRAELANSRQKLTSKERRLFKNMQSKAIARQMAYLGKNIDFLFRGAAESQNVVDKPEFFSFLAISLFFLVLTVLFAIFPKLIAYPLVFLLFVAFSLTAYRSWQTFQIIRQHNRLPEEINEEEK